MLEDNRNFSDVLNMSSNVQIHDSKQAFYRKAAWFSFLTPWTCLFIVIVNSSLPNHFSFSTQILIDKLITWGVFLLSFGGMIIGGFGIRTRSNLSQILAAIGIVVSLIIGAMALFLILLTLGHEE